ncbi:MAG: WYL domain-containing protein [Clostridia bacterium]|nr:WYL domain-containing protein [Clostridia bacterium]
MPKKKTKDNTSYLSLILEVLRKNTNVNNPANYTEISEMVQKETGEEKGLDPRTVKKSIETLIELNFKLVKRTGGYYYDKRFLDVGEAKLLTDQILFSTLLPPDRKKNIVNSIISDLSESDINKIKSNITTDYKSQLQTEVYKDTLANVGKILDAIEKDKKISFSYGDYDEKKKIVLNGKEYRVSPYEFLYEEGKYYVMSQHEKEEDTEELRNFRVDLMRNIKVLNSHRAEFPLEVENIQDYCLKSINMYGNEAESISLELDRAGLRGLYDKLGLDTKIRVSKIEINKYKADFEASVEGTKYFVLQYLDHTRVLKPSSLKKSVIKSLKDAMERNV